MYTVISLLLRIIRLFNTALKRPCTPLSSAVGLREPAALHQLATPSTGKSHFQIMPRNKDPLHNRIKNAFENDASIRRVRHLVCIAVVRLWIPRTHRYSIASDRFEIIQQSENNFTVSNKNGGRIRARSQSETITGGTTTRHNDSSPCVLFTLFFSDGNISVRRYSICTVKLSHATEWPLATINPSDAISCADLSEKIWMHPSGGG